MQQAYYSESAVAGGWTLIGYTMTSTTNFKFLENGTVENGVAAASSTALGTASVTWGAQNKAALNDCTIDSKWQLTVAKNSAAGGGARYGAEVTGGPTGKCVILTPSFGKLSPDPVTVAK
ncbi:MAG: hypothetical protein J6A06_03950 [Fibrobacteraceae bacterium]|nr:hypothetical protein [Fibrobacteraceae bacterium]